jgi:hypothetical protein
MRQYRGIIKEPFSILEALYRFEALPGGIEDGFIF